MKNCPLSRHTSPISYIRVLLMYLLPKSEDTTESSAHSKINPTNFCQCSRNKILEKRPISFIIHKSPPKLLKQWPSASLLRYYITTSARYMALYQRTLDMIVLDLPTSDIYYPLRMYHDRISHEYVDTRYGSKSKDIRNQKSSEVTCLLRTLEL